MTRQPFKPENGHRIKLRLVVPEQPVRLQDLQNLKDIIRADVFEGPIKLGRFKIKDIEDKMR